VGRRLGQHFLTDPAILDRIVAALEPCSEDLVIEVGPGRGSLTRRLAPLVGRVLAIERDKALVAELRGERGEGSRSPPPDRKDAETLRRYQTM
jgi:16S rRNA (adenine1518-N6/adenine1519-N6)-dimethyltransferase